MKQPRWQRRAEDRPREICAAALEVFAEKGFAAARLDEIARRAGVSKGTLYLYFKDKEDLFRAVVRDAIAPNVAAITEVISTMQAPFADVVRMFLAGFAERDLTDPDPPRLLHLWFGTHPTIRERIDFALRFHSQASDRTIQ